MTKIKQRPRELRRKRQTEQDHGYALVERARAEIAAFTAQHLTCDAVVTNYFDALAAFE